MLGFADFKLRTAFLDLFKASNQILVWAVRPYIFGLEPVLGLNFWTVMFTTVYKLIIIQVGNNSVLAIKKVQSMIDFKGQNIQNCF